MRRERARIERVYVKVSSEFDATGYMQPRAITWGDGRVFAIEGVRDYCPWGESPRRGCDRYTVLIRGQEKILYFERADPRFPSRVGRWFIERAAAQAGG